MESMICENAYIAERRRTPRMPYQTTALYHIATTDGAGTVKDISSEGMFLETPLTLDIGNRISLAFRLRTSKFPMNITGEIVRSTPAGVGVRFLWK